MRQSWQSGSGLEQAGWGTPFWCLLAQREITALVCVVAWGALLPTRLNRPGGRNRAWGRGIPLFFQKSYRTTTCREVLLIRSEGVEETKLEARKLTG